MANNAATNLTRRHGAVKTSNGMGVLIIMAATLISCVSSFQIYKEGFTDLPQLAGIACSLLAVILVEGAFGWLVYGFTRAFSTILERILSFAGMSFLLCAMCLNIVTHYMIVRQKPLSPFQQVWLDWAAVTVFLVILVLAIAIKLANPLTRLMRLELRAAGKEIEVLLAAKLEALDSETVYQALAQRAEIEADQFAQRVIGNGTGSSFATARDDKRVEGFGRAIWRGGRRIDQEELGN